MNAAPVARVAIYEGQGAQALDEERRFQLLRGLLDNGYAVTNIRSESDGLSRMNADDNVTVVLGHFEQSDLGYKDSGDASPRWCNIDGMELPAIYQAVESARTELAGTKPAKWKPWFPVIDYQRCTNCMQCMSFCLFDVYSVSREGKIQVQNQSNCKTDCPACSRVCPEVAILFPKYRFSPISGDEINSEDVRREAMKVDISALLGGDIYAALRDRSAKAKSRFSKERDEERALKERQRCLEKLQQGLDIPAEVLASLPSPEQIQIKAEEAKARAQAAHALAGNVGAGS
jgi:Pyruvate/2-oxoacid:ferredoxin oxidoreductase delta subunit